MIAEAIFQSKLRYGISVYTVPKFDSNNLSYFYNPNDPTARSLDRPKPWLTEFGIHHRLESCERPYRLDKFLTI